MAEWLDASRAVPLSGISVMAMGSPRRCPTLNFAASTDCRRTGAAAAGRAGGAITCKSARSRELRRWPPRARRRGSRRSVAWYETVRTRGAGVRAQMLLIIPAWTPDAQADGGETGSSCSRPRRRDGRSSAASPPPPGCSRRPALRAPRYAPGGRARPRRRTSPAGAAGRATRVAP